jgi:RND family efflux transporter MFP subunit
MTDPVTPSRGRFPFGRLFVEVAVVAGLLGATGWGYSHLLDTAPHADRKSRSRQPLLVEVVPAEVRDHRVELRGLGTVVPARRVAIHAEVAGRVVGLAAACEPGVVVAAGTELARLDRRDLELDRRRLAADLIQVERDLALEAAGRAAGEAEVGLLGPGLPAAERALVLREPQLAALRAQADARRAALERLDLDLDRCTVRVPFPCILTEVMVAPGSRVAPGTVIAQAVETARCWVELTLPQTGLAWLPPAGAAARIVDAGDRPAKVLRVLPVLEDAGRLARVLVEVPAPFDPAAGPPLLIGGVVEVAVAGRTITGAVVLPRALLRDEDRVWVMDAAGVLRIRKVVVRWRDREVAVIDSGLAAGEQVVAGTIAAPVDGMALRTVAAGDRRP